MKYIEPYGDCNYKDSNCFRILPGLEIDSLAFITEKGGTWYQKVGNMYRRYVVSDK